MGVINKSDNYIRIRNSIKTSSGEPYSKIGFTSVNDIKNLGGDVVYTPTKDDPFHSTIMGISPNALSNIMKVINNPFKR